jgi:DNA-binding transcriptional regulator YbjK
MTSVPVTKAAASSATKTKTKASSRASRPRGRARREALLEAVLKVVAEAGTDAVTHRRVAEVAELPLASTTYWFESKEHLLTAALELAAERDLARLREDTSGAAADTEPLELAVRAIVSPTEPVRSSLITTYALLLEAARRPALRAIAERWTEAYLRIIGRLLEQAGSARPREDAELLLAAADGLLMEQLASGHTSDLRPRLIRLGQALVERP